jgi:prepilin-type processing-associated H-X9-DG protein
MKGMTEMKTGPSWNATGIVFVIFCFVMLLCMPLSRNSRYQAHAIWCGNSQRQIVGACIAYAQQEGGIWPMPWSIPEAFPKSVPEVAHSAHVIAVRCMETLAHVCKLPNSLFLCPCSPLKSPISPPDAETDINGTWGVGPSNEVSFAFDWALSGNQSGPQIVLADRDPSYHFGKPNVCFADNHVKAIKFTSQVTFTIAFPNIIRTEGSDGKPVLVIGAMPEDDATNEGFGNIYEADPLHVKEQLTPYGGKSARTWVK